MLMIRCQEHAPAHEQMSNSEMNQTFVQNKPHTEMLVGQDTKVFYH